MSQKEDDEKKLERIRKMLDDPYRPVSYQHNEKYLATLQRRLTGGTTQHHDHMIIPSPLTSDDLTPHVVVHHRLTQDQPVESVKTTIEIEEKSRDEGSVFDDEELFEIEKPDEATIPEFIEVEPVLKEEDEQNTSLVESPVSDTQKSLEHLPLWHTVEEDTVVSSPCKEDKDGKGKQKKRLPRPFMNSVVKHDAKEPEIWEEECSEEEKKGKHSQNSEPQDKDVKKKRGIEKVSKKVPFKRFEGNTKDTNKKKVSESSSIKQTMEKEERTKTTAFKQLSEKGRFSSGDYTLYKKQLRIGGKEIRTVHFFSKDAPEDSTPSELPEGYEVKVNEKTGVPYIKKSR